MEDYSDFLKTDTTIVIYLSNIWFPFHETIWVPGTGAKESLKEMFDKIKTVFTNSTPTFYDSNGVNIPAP